MQKPNAQSQLNNPIGTTSGKNGFYVQLGSLLICWGLDGVSSAGTTINFAKPFSGTPSVTCTIADTNNQTAWAQNPSSTNVILHQIYASNPLGVSWVAIGMAA